MYFLTLIILLIFILFAYIIERKRSSMLLLYMCVWFVVVFLCGLHLDDAIPFDSKMYMYVIMGSVAFGLGYSLFRIFRIGDKKSVVSNTVNQKYVLNTKLLKILLIIILIFEAIQALQVLSLLMSGVSWTSIRYNYYVTGKIMTELENQISTWIVLPIMHFVALPVILVETKNKTIIRLVAIDAFLLVFTSQAKEIFIYWTLAILIFYLQSNIKLSYKTKKRFFVIMTVFVVVMLGIQYSRSGKISLGFVNDYLGIQLNLMDHWFQYIDINELQGYGAAFFNGILNVIYSALEFIGVDTPEKIAETYKDLTYMMSTGVQTNFGKAASTNIYITQNTFFYYDFRELGIILENFIFGSIIGGFSKWFSHQKGTGISDVLFIVVAIGTICSIIYWLPQMTAYILAFVYLRLCYRKKKVEYE